MREQPQKPFSEGSMIPVWPEKPRVSVVPESHRPAVSAKHEAASWDADIHLQPA